MKNRVSWHEMAEILDTLKLLYEKRCDDIEQWLAARRAESAPYFYTSVDLRHSRHKLAPVDTNLFPAGFNNLSPRARLRASRFIKRLLQDAYPQARRALIIPEGHTRNIFYLENLATLAVILEQVDLEVRIGRLDASEPVELESASGKKIVQHPLVRDEGTLRLTGGFTPDLIILNNDMTSGAPAILENLAQPVVPPVSMGWYRRRKSVHFDAYKKLAQKFCREFSLDPWLLGAEFYACGLIDFKERTGLDRVAAGIESVLKKTQKKYREYGIAEEPYAFVKADSGTYGMGVITVRAPDDILDLNKKERNKMQVVKEGAPVHEVIIQEGVPTADDIDGHPAEPMIYMVDGVPVGGMWRYNPERDAFTNLNAGGMKFTGMCDEGEDECGQWKAVEDCHFRSFGLVAAIAALAAGREDYESFMINL